MVVQQIQDEDSEDSWSKLSESEAWELLKAQAREMLQEPAGSEVPERPVQPSSEYGRVRVVHGETAPSQGEK